jgi:hypothetical protein
MSMKKLIRLHKLAKEHPYRLRKFGSPETYGKLLRELLDEFVKQVDSIYGKHEIRDVTPNHPFGVANFEHDYKGVTRAIEASYRFVDEYVAIAEYYLTTIHAFIETGEVKFFWMSFGYTEGCGHDEWKWNRMSAYKYIHYSERKEWDMDKSSAERWLLILEKKLKKRIDYQERRNVEGVEPSKIADGIIDFYTKRIERLRQIVEENGVN